MSATATPAPGPVAVARARLETHHVWAKRFGGSDHAANLRTYCPEHHVMAQRRDDVQARMAIDAVLRNVAAPRRAPANIFLMPSGPPLVPRVPDAMLMRRKPSAPAFTAPLNDPTSFLSRILRDTSRTRRP